MSFWRRFLNCKETRKTLDPKGWFCYSSPSTLRFIFRALMSDDVLCVYQYTKGAIHGAFRRNDDEPG